MEGKNGKIRLTNDSLGKSAAPSLRQSPAAVGLRLISAYPFGLFCIAVLVSLLPLATAQRRKMPDRICRMPASALLQSLLLAPFLVKNDAKSRLFSALRKFGTFAKLRHNAHLLLVRRTAVCLTIIQ